MFSWVSRQPGNLLQNMLKEGWFLPLLKNNTCKPGWSIMRQLLWTGNHCFSKQWDAIIHSVAWRTEWLISAVKWLIKSWMPSMSAEKGSTLICILPSPYLNNSLLWIPWIRSNNHRWAFLPLHDTLLKLVPPDVFAGLENVITVTDNGDGTGRELLQQIFKGFLLPVSAPWDDGAARGTHGEWMLQRWTVPGWFHRHWLALPYLKQH